MTSWVVALPADLVSKECHHSTRDILKKADRQHHWIENTSYDETIVKITTINVQNKNNIDVLNCKANTRSSYTTKTAILYTKRWKDTRDGIVHHY